METEVDVTKLANYNGHGSKVFSNAEEENIDLMLTKFRGHQIIYPDGLEKYELTRGVYEEIVLGKVLKLYPDIKGEELFDLYWSQLRAYIENFVRQIDNNWRIEKSSDVFSKYINRIYKKYLNQIEYLKNMIADWKRNGAEEVSNSNYQNYRIAKIQIELLELFIKIILEINKSELEEVVSKLPGFRIVHPDIQIPKESTKIVNVDDALSLKDCFADVNYYNKIIEMLIQKGYLSKKNLVWQDKHKGHKLLAASIIKNLFIKGYFNFKKGLNNEQIQDVILNSFCLNVSVATIKIADEESQVVDFIPKSTDLKI